MAYAFVLSFPVAIKTPILILLILFWVTDRRDYKREFKDINKIFFLMVIFFLYIAISSFWSDASTKEIFIGIKKYWYFIPIFIIFKYIKKEYITYVVSFFLLGMLISEFLSYGVIFSFWKIRFATQANPSIFLHHIQYGIFLALTAIILFFKGFYDKNSKMRVVYFLFFITVTLNLFLNIGRTGYIVFLVTLVLTLTRIYKFRVKAVLTILITTIFSIILVYSISSNFRTRVHQGTVDMQKLTTKDDYNTSIGSRFALWVAAEEIWVKNPLFGVGVAEHIDKKNKFAKENKKFEFLSKIKHFHNTFLEILTQFGLVGLSLFLYILYLISQIPIKNRFVNILKISLLSIFILGNFADRLFYLNSTMSLFALMCGLILAQYRFENRTTKYAV